VKVLVIGGTRLLGLSVVHHLIESQHLVTVLSRRHENRPSGARFIGADRGIGLVSLAGESFDMVIDFVAYNSAAVLEVLNKLPDTNYVLISSTWMTRLTPNSSVDKQITDIDLNSLASLSVVTRNYLLGKREAESAVFKARQEGQQATVLRLPIFFGDGDHTGRLDFYKRRYSDHGAIILVDGGRNLAQIAWTEDIARAFPSWLPVAIRYPIWNALADAGLPVRQIIEYIIGNIASPTRFVDIPSVFLAEHLPLYLESEPLWKETPLTPSENNIFLVTGTFPTPYFKWLSFLSGAPDQSPSELREKELRLIERI
jgi:nucleoside-diphosphate-sugar epimerase